MHAASFAGCCYFVGCGMDCPHLHIVCPRCGTLNYRGECGECHYWQRKTSREFLRLYGLDRPSILPLRTDLDAA